MTKRFTHIRRLVTLRQRIASNPNAADGILRATIIESLPDQYRLIFYWIEGASVTTPLVMDAWGLNANHASTILKELWEFGLLQREQRVDESGRVFIYRYKSFK